MSEELCTVTVNADGQHYTVYFSQLIADVVEGIGHEPPVEIVFTALSEEFKAELTNDTWGATNVTLPETNSGFWQLSFLLRPGISQDRALTRLLSIIRRYCHIYAFVIVPQ